MLTRGRFTRREGDHELQLPTPVHNPDRDFGGQRFCRSESEKAVWAPGRLPGFEMRETGISAATRGAASVRVARPAGATSEAWNSHTADILFSFVLSGSLTLRGEGTADHALTAGDAFVIPPGMRTTLAGCSGDLELLEVSLPGAFETRTHSN